jgi:alpha-beta hydrolase superfamily lysophospholipase
LYKFQNRFLFVPTKTIEDTPANYKLSYKEVWLPIEGKDRIYAWWIPAQSNAAPTVLYCHGNGHNIGEVADLASRFHKMGLSVFAFDYRGYGKSEGAFPSETAVYTDAKRAWDYLTLDQKIPPQRIAIYGHSLGGAIAINLAIQHPNASGLIVQSSFSNALEMAKRNWWTAIFPVNALLNQRFESLHKVSQLQMPVLYLHGTADTVIPFEMSQRLFEKTRSPKQLKLFPGAGHNDLPQVGGAVYARTVKDFMIRVQK